MIRVTTLNPAFACVNEVYLCFVMHNSHYTASERLIADMKCLLSRTLFISNRA
jgi:hypothetical protein